MSFLYKKAAIHEKVHRTIVLLKDIVNYYRILNYNIYVLILEFYA